MLWENEQRAQNENKYELLFTAWAPRITLSEKYMCTDELIHQWVEQMCFLLYVQVIITRTQLQTCYGKVIITRTRKIITRTQLQIFSGFVHSCQIAFDTNAIFTLKQDQVRADLWVVKFYISWTHGTFVIRSPTVACQSYVYQHETRAVAPPTKARPSLWTCERPPTDLWWLTTDLRPVYDRPEFSQVMASKIRLTYHTSLKTDLRPTCDCIHSFHEFAAELAPTV